ncbi:MAG: DUF3977 family protein [Patescibacteria group bacterium]|jgi:hypothetical protein
MKKVFAEIGIGNESICSTEFEEVGGIGGEFRVSRFILPEHITEIYLRFWIGHRVFVLSTLDGFKAKNKSKKALKILFGIGGTGNIPLA